MIQCIILLIHQNYILMYNKTKQTTTKNLQFIGAAVHSGQNLEGVDKGPEAIRNSGLFKALESKYEVKTKDHGDINL